MDPSALGAPTQLVRVVCLRRLTKKISDPRAPAIVRAGILIAPLLVFFALLSAVPSSITLALQLLTASIGLSGTITAD